MLHVKLHEGTLIHLPNHMVDNVHITHDWWTVCGTTMWFLTMTSCHVATRHIPGRIPLVRSQQRMNNYNRV